METIYNIDFAINDAIAKLNNPFLDVIMNFFSFLAHSGWAWILLAFLLLLFRKTRVLGVAMTVALVFSVLVTNLTLKPIFDRPRPYQIRPELLDIIGNRTALPDDASFPSGHTSASFAGAVALFLQRKKYKKAGTAFGFSALAVACLIAFSRLYFYVHFPSDVFVGMIIGITGGILSWLLAPRLLPLANRFFDKFYSLFRKKEPIPAVASSASPDVPAGSSANAAPADPADPIDPVEAPADPADPVEASADPVAANAPDPIQDKK